VSVSVKKELRPSSGRGKGKLGGGGKGGRESSVWGNKNRNAASRVKKKPNIFGGLGHCTFLVLPVPHPSGPAIGLVFQNSRALFLPFPMFLRGGGSWALPLSATLGFVRHQPHQLCVKLSNPALGIN